MGESEKYEVLETIGRGSFGTIRKVKRTSDGHILCRKEIQYIKMSQKEREQLHAEFSILNSLKHPNIVGYYHREHLKSSQELYLYMEYCGGGDLSKEIRKLKAQNQYADEEYVWSIFSQLVAALYRCHYGVDTPEVGNKVFGVKAMLKPLGLKAKNQVMILHRDLKPENVFLGHDSSVKLGDFGLSKLMQSHDFASTYVGTPFYMSPEICAAERYTLHSDIWSLGCVIYELCARTPPFNAKTHLQLIQKIKEGRLDPLPSIYSQDLQNVIKSCLNVNPLKRPDTISLLNLPAVRLMRKEREVVELGRILKDKEEHLMVKASQSDRKASEAEIEREQMRAAMESSMRREWEVKAGLEISRQVQMEKERLNKIFDAEVRLRVQTEIAKAMRAEANKTAQDADIHTCSQEDSIAHISSTSTVASTSTDFTSQTEMSSLANDDSQSDTAKSKTPPRRRARGPLARARTQFDSPMDIPMIDPSPMSIAGLSLSPRRTETTAIPGAGKNIFAAAAVKHRLQPQSSSPTPSTSMEDDEDILPDLPSPTRAPTGMPDPFKPAPRPGLLRQKTAPMTRLAAQPKPSLFPHTAAERPCRVPSPTSPKHSGFSPSRKAPPRPVVGATEELGGGMFKAVMQRNLIGQNANGSGISAGGGRTLVELAQARAGGVCQTQKNEGVIKENVRALSTVTADVEATVWDPERDEMPSPFLVRGGRGMRRL